MTAPGDSAGASLRRRAAVLLRIRKALDAFYLLQDIDWEFDVRQTLDKILDLALHELRLEGGTRIERAMIILTGASSTELECHAGWFSGSRTLEFSRSIVHDVLATGETLVCLDAAADDRFRERESVQRLELASFVAIPIAFGANRVGAFFADTGGADTGGSGFPRLANTDREFLEEFVATITPYLKSALLHRTHLDQIEIRSEPATRFHALVGASPPMRGLFDSIRLVANSNATVLVQGETGTGKELVAQAIHAESLSRRRGPFVPVNCSAIPRALLESELFGHTKGAFSGATADREGLAAAADGGTLFLDEIGEIEIEVQAKLLRFLQSAEFRPVGSDRSRRADVRVVTATNRNLSEEVARGRFREDLFYRVNVLPLTVPPLRERAGDLPLLATHILERWAATEGTTPKRASQGLLERLSRHSWPGNVRELEHALYRASLFARGPEVAAEDLPADFRGPPAPETGEQFGQSLDQVRRLGGEAGERDYIERALAQARGEAAGRVDLLERAVRLIGDSSLPTLRRRIKRLGIDLDRYVAKQTGRRPRPASDRGA